MLGRPEKVILLTISDNSSRQKTVKSLEELESLARTAGCEVTGKFIQIKENPDPAFYIGKGKVQEMKQIIKEKDIDAVIFDVPLSGRYHRNLEQELNIKVIDRVELIMDIFAQHARTKAAKIQVELAQLKYRLTQLKGRGRDLSRLGGGIGTRGPGEKKLEVDRRKIMNRINALNKELKRIEISKRVQRKRRKQLIQIALVGYTNAGKSSLMNLLTGSTCKVENTLFSTLDTTTRRIKVPLNIPILLTDTVGFIENLPAELVVSFRSTLSVVKEADMLIEVIDISEENFREKMQVVEETLIGLGAGAIPRISVFNKTDLVLDTEYFSQLSEDSKNTFYISCKTKEGFENFKNMLVQKIKELLKIKYFSFKI